MIGNGVIYTNDIEAAVAALRSGRCTALVGVRAKWGDAEAGRLAAALRAGGDAELKTLHLDDNAIADAGAASLAAAVAAGACPQLK